jgi:hypothetical protein
MLRWVLALAVLGSGCFANEGYCYRQRLSGPEVGLLAGLFALQVLSTLPAEAQSAPPRPTGRLFVGNLRFDTGQPAANLRVTLRGSGDLVSLVAVTDFHGDFRFPLPVPPDWYLVGVDDPGLVGTVRVWLDQRGPGGLVLTARARVAAGPGD